METNSGTPRSPRLQWGERTTWRVFGASAESNAWTAGLVIVGMLALSWGIATVVGGAASVAPHWFYIPIMFAAIRFGPWGALVAGVASVFLAGPLLPAVVATGEAQPASDWVTRGAFFIAIGQVLAFALRRPSLTWTAAAQNLRTERALLRGIARGELEVHYQAIVDIRGRGQRLSGAEALVRWHHPKHVLVLPDRFIPIAEDCGLIHDIGDVVLADACRNLLKWTELSGRRRFGIAVNLSARQLADEDLSERVARCLRETGADPACVSFEITETAVMADIDTSISQLGALKRLGTRIAIDDFGTGYSSLAYVHQLPVDAVKIDRCFTSRIATDTSAANLVDNIIHLTHTLGLDAVAEGVEKLEQLVVLKTMRCDYAQGFHLGRPGPSEQTTKALRQLAAPRPRASGRGRQSALRATARPASSASARVVS
jgi:EAL domain-containing protein (putative c-di-GMP-specific phosphodiesterase class I)